METAKSHARRVREGWFDRFCPEHLSGIDIGSRHDPVNHTFRRWDKCFGDGDATDMAGVPDAIFSTVYASHILEHLDDDIGAIRNWWRILKPGGHLIVVVPHRDLYEKKSELPSNWNGEHKRFYVPGDLVMPNSSKCTYSLLETIVAAIPMSRGEIVSLRVLDEGFESDGPDTHSRGEYSIEAVIKKLG